VTGFKIPAGVLAQHIAVLGMVEYWHHGTGQFANIEYCDFCGYSKTHGHGQQCIITRLNTALDGATSTSKGVE
jgi:hypothetical protein